MAERESERERASERERESERARERERRLISQESIDGFRDFVNIEFRRNFLNKLLNLNKSLTSFFNANVLLLLLFYF